MDIKPRVSERRAHHGAPVRQGNDGSFAPQHVKTDRRDVLFDGPHAGSVPPRVPVDRPSPTGSNHEHWPNGESARGIHRQDPSATSRDRPAQRRGTRTSSLLLRDPMLTMQDQQRSDDETQRSHPQPGGGRTRLAAMRAPNSVGCSSAVELIQISRRGRPRTPPFHRSARGWIRPSPEALGNGFNLNTGTPAFLEQAWCRGRSGRDDPANIRPAPLEHR
jgi:hypothetical protein